jgi:6-pyruvoyltetrahydropterin/6-carboxytetrahydropterin synthase
MPDRYLERAITVEMGHRLMNHTGKCRNIHGHSWRIKAAVSGDIIKDSLASEEGMIIDLSVLSDMLKVHIDNTFDHSLTLDSRDPLVGVLTDQHAQPDKQMPWGYQFICDFGKINVLHNMAPTSENLADVWARILMTKLPGHVTLVALSVKETENSETAISF